MDWLKEHKMWVIVGGIALLVLANEMGWFGAM